jgi:molybdopterin synthase sulfur carrier subunit
MTIRVLYFAGLREALGQASEQVALPAQVANVGQLHAHLAARGGAWETLAQTRNLRVAVNQQMAALDAPVKDGDEVAFFPPVTGG